jgi:REP element-mobilizing transposase RayT
VTFRLKDSIPATAWDAYHRRREILTNKLEQTISTGGSSNTLDAVMTLRAEMAELQESMIEPVLNESHGECWLQRPEIAGLVLDALKHFDGDRYTLLCWSVMPNHVHAILQPHEGQKLENILHSWKSFTAKMANELLGRTGGFWQEEYYDHVVRDGEDFRNQIRYVLENPRKGQAAGEWTGSRYGATWEEVLGAGRSDHGLEQDAPATFTPRHGLEQDAPATFTPRHGLEQDAPATFTPRHGLEQDAPATFTPRHGLEQDAPATYSEAPCASSAFVPSYDPFTYERRSSSSLTVMGHDFGGEHPVRVFTTQARWNALAHGIAGMGDFKPEIIVEKSGVVAIDPRDPEAVDALNRRPGSCLVTVADGTGMEVIAAFRLLAARADARHPVLLKDTLDVSHPQDDATSALLTSARNLGSLLCDGIGDAVLVRGETDPGQSLRLAYNILQAAGRRIFKTDYVACPSCGRTLFNLQQTTRKIRASTGHLKGVRIAVMGCIVNGPGEMADADFGYVGGAPNKINLYVGKTAVKFNIPEDEAVQRLIDLIREHGKWVDAPPPATPQA